MNDWIKMVADGYRNVDKRLAKVAELLKRLWSCPERAYSSGSATATAPERLFGPGRTGAGFRE